MQQREQFEALIRADPDNEHTRIVFADWLEERGETELSVALRHGQVPFMLRKGEEGRFQKSIVAQDDDNDYDESGYVVVRVGDWCAMARYSHCSCYGTWASITGGGISDSEGPNHPCWDWQGTWEKLLDMANRKADPAMPDRGADPSDYDYDHLCNVYQQILEAEARETP
jgi:uncharacterized protein (TIGR02996 family)